MNNPKKDHIKGLGLRLKPGQVLRLKDGTAIKNVTTQETYVVLNTLETNRQKSSQGDANGNKKYK